MKAADPVRSTCERDFIIAALQKGIRQDGRKFYDYRKIKISFGESFGHCEVCIGKTRALAQVSCEVVKPGQTRPNEGQLFVNIELSPMASPAFETGRPSDEAVEVNRFVERCLREARPVDLESLCIIAGEKVWCLRVDIQILDDLGNILDCACLAAMSALSHFRRPDVTVVGKDITIHSFDDKEPISLSVHHIPICITLGFIDVCEKPIIDPTELEEYVLDGTMVVAVNSHMEICCAKTCGVAIDPDKIVMCCRIASSKVEGITEKIKKSLEKDKEKRFPQKEPVKLWRVGDDEGKNILKTIAEPTKIDITETVKEATDNATVIATIPAKEAVLSLKGPKIVTVGDGGSNAWILSDDDKDKDDDVSVSITKSTKNHSKIDQITIDGDSEEEETLQLTQMDLEYTNKNETQRNAAGSDDEIMIVDDSARDSIGETQTQKKRKRKKNKTSN